MFNNETSDAERKTRLTEVIKQKKYDSETLKEVPNDEQLNEMIARSDEELVEFNAMDQ